MGTLKKAVAILLLGVTVSAMNSHSVSITDEGTDVETPDIPESNSADPYNSDERNADAVLTAVQKCDWKGCNTKANLDLVHHDFTNGGKRWYFCTPAHCKRPSLKMVYRRRL